MRRVLGLVFALSVTFSWLLAAPLPDPQAPAGDDLKRSRPAAYVVMLKNGSRIIAREKYTVKGTNALVVLKNGALTAIPLAQVDLAATDRVNADRLGDALALDWVDAQGTPLPTPAPTASVTSIGRLREGLGRPLTGAQPTPTPGIQYHERAFRDSQVEKAFLEGLERSHLYLYRASEGTRKEVLFLEVQVNGQQEVVRALQAITLTFHLLVDKAPERAPAAVEIQMINESGKEAGVFRISREDAAELATGKITPEDFFVKHVIF